MEHPKKDPGWRPGPDVQEIIEADKRHPQYSTPRQFRALTEKLGRLLKFQARQRELQEEQRRRMVSR